jgi:dipeptidase E
MKTNIIAIGGGNIKTGETKTIDQIIVEQSGKSSPHVLFIPTASSDNPDYIKTVTEHFESLNCIVDSLKLITEKPSQEMIAHKIASADIIYVGGGNTLKMMRQWRKLGVDNLLAQARSRGAILCGLSAGSICWFAYGNSDSRKFKNPSADLIRVTGLGFIDALHCPHYHKEADRKLSLKEMTRKTRNLAIALDDGAAIHVKDIGYRILQSLPGAHAYKIYWHNGVFYEERLELSKEFTSLETLLSKKA